MAVIECAGCGKEAISGWDFCPDCGADPTTGGQVVTPSVAVAVATAKQPAAWGGWALGLVLASIPLNWIPAAAPALSAFRVVAMLLWLGALIAGIVGVIHPPGTLAIIALVLCVLPIALVVTLAMLWT